MELNASIIGTDARFIVMTLMPYLWSAMALIGILFTIPLERQRNALLREAIELANTPVARVLATQALRSVRARGVVLGTFFLFGFAAASWIPPYIRYGLFTLLFFVDNALITWTSITDLRMLNAVRNQLLGDIDQENITPPRRRSTDGSESEEHLKRESQ